MAYDIKMLQTIYFPFDLPVPFKLNSIQSINIYPVSVQESEIFLSSIDIISIDKNIVSDVNIIQMSYLQFIIELIRNNESLKQKLVNILIICLHLKWPEIIYKENRPCIYDKELDITITSKHFDEIKRIILYQNLVHYDDEYINPDVKKAIDDYEKIKSRNIELPTLERKISLITSHTGLSKSEQLKMSFRAHSLLFEEMRNEIEYTLIKPLALYSGKGKELEDLFFRNKKDKFDKYFVKESDYKASMGNNKALQSQ